MTGQKRGFGRERHNAMKVAVAVASVAGFGAAWYALGQGHPPLTGTPIDAVAGATAANVTPMGSSTGQLVPAPLPPRRARTSRGS